VKEGKQKIGGKDLHNHAEPESPDPDRQEYRKDTAELILLDLLASTKPALTSVLCSGPEPDGQHEYPLSQPKKAEMT